MKKLSDHAFNVFSQFGEDGIIEKIFDIIGVSSKICIEFGAWDGFHLSNTANLWAKKGWKGILMELDAERFKQLVENTNNHKCHCIQAKVEASGQNTLDEILKRAGVTEQIDLLSIDIDGDDYHIFESLSETSPRLVICEYNPTIPPEIELVAEPGNYFGCSALSLVKLAEKKGYKLIAVTDTNCFFVRETEFSHFADYETSFPAIAVTRHLTYFVTGFAGDYLFSQKPIFGCEHPTSQKFTLIEKNLFFMPDKPGLETVEPRKQSFHQTSQPGKNQAQNADMSAIKKLVRHPGKTVTGLLQKAKKIIRHPRKAAFGIFPNVKIFAKQTQAGGPLRLRRIKNASGGLDAEFLREIAAMFDVKAFVETGTYLGETTAAAAKIFDQVHTIELSPELARQATARLAPFPNVQVIEGDSSKALASILPKLRGRTLFWLDGHYSEGNTARGEGGNTPIIEELRTIQAAGIKDAIILVDDLHLFQKVTYQGSDAPSIYGYPDIHQLRQTILGLGENYQFFVLGACALAFPGSLNASAAPMLQALTVSRLSGGDKQALQEVIEVEAAIIRAGAEDREFLRDLHRQFVNSEKYGLGLHYRYWVALGNIGDKKFAEAAADLDALVKSGFQHSRLKFHLENSLKASGQASRVHPPLQLQPGQDVLGQLQTAGLWQPSQPLRLHLGCGEQHFDGYLNLDYPPSSHNVMQVQADAWANILTLDFPDQSVDEVRLHHVFEHFNRVTALAMLIKWHRWLKVGGQLCIETPDLMGSAKTLLSDKSFKTKMGVARHLAGDQAATWAYHLEHWFPERYKHTLGQLGFENIKVETSSWPHEPCLSNVTARAVKQRVVSLEDQLRAADDLLWQSTVADVEKPTHDVWIRQLRAVLNDALVERPVNAALPDLSAIKNAPTLLGHSSSKFTLDEIHNFNQTDRDAWVRAKAATIPSGARVLDVGAGTCPYRNFFAHCKYETHDFKKYEGVKLGNTSEYGQIDYVSEIVAIPAPDNSFDAILCTEVLEHVPEPIEALREMARLVKPGGRLLITAPLGSGLHQLPFHFYGGYTPEWYRHFAKKFGLEVFGITPNGGFFKLLAQECARVAWTFPQHEHLHGKQGKFIRQLFGESLPRYLFALEEKHFIDQFTVGYHVELLKPSIDNMKSSAISFK